MPVKEAFWSGPNSVSEANLFFCGGGSCGRGWWPTKAIERLKTEGVSDERCFPYNPWDQNCVDSCTDWRSRRVKINDYGSVGNEQMKQALVTYGPLITTFDVYEDFFYYTDGVYEHVWGSVAGGHCVTIIGYDDSQGYWICKNSWGTSWGENGFFNIKYGECGIDGPGSCAYFESCTKSMVYTNPYVYHLFQRFPLLQHFFKDLMII